MMNLDKVFTKHDDAAHGWLEVSIEDLIDLNIQDKISDFSYIDSIEKLIYLEEDVDMTLFMKSYKDKYNKELMFVIENNFEIHPIRNLPCYINCQIIDKDNHIVIKDHMNCLVYSFPKKV
tara:strand:- start:544 stop:903 length:360 start_codon:yes stop_codon:yes gene_type:complete